jgi:two-component system, OmpR family, phosphate regulon sensor histidine kinase PhoR
MSNRNIRIIFILAILSTISIIFTQYLAVKKASELSEKNFDQKVKFVLYAVGENLLRSSYKDYKSDMDMVERITPDYYIVKVNDKINYKSLKQLLIRDLQKSDLKTVFEFGIYDCETEEMQKGERVNMLDSSDKNIAAKMFPKQKKENYYFGVNFPERDKILNAQLMYLKAGTAAVVGLLSLLAYIVFVVFKQKRLQEIQKDFVNNMTHEFKTPLSTIQIASEVLKNPKIINNPERLLNYATIVGNETLHLTGQVERVLQMAQTEKGAMLLKYSDFNLEDVYEEMINKYRGLVRSRGGDLIFSSTQENLPIKADLLHFKNTISNLIDNAIKYTEQNPKIVITTTDKGKNYEIAVEDNGIGIPKEHQENVFSKFFRVPTGNVHDVKGFGLGLSYVKLIMKRHKGDVYCSSEMGKGTKFTLVIPKN